MKNDKMMSSIRELYRIGRGPSSSHTMGPERACLQMKKKYPEANCYRVTLYGSLAMTGAGHGTDRVIRETLSPMTGDVVFDRKTPTERHPNMMDFTLFKNGKELSTERIWSIGGGAIFPDCEECGEGVYPLSTFRDIARECTEKNVRLWQYAEAVEGEGFFPYLEKVWEAMKASIERGLSVRGILPGGLGTERRAQIIYQKKHIDESPQTRENRLVSSYAFAVSEENAAGGVIVTAPTCGSSGVLPAVLRYMKLTDGAHTLLHDMFFVLALYMVGRCVNTIVINGVFTAGGDTLFDFYSLAVCMWCLAVPLAFLGAFVFHWHPVLVYACTCVDEVGKLPWVYLHFRRYKWVRNLTR